MSIEGAFILQQGDVEDLLNTELDDIFMEDNINRHFDADFSRQTLQEVCDLFVQAFLLDNSDEVSSLHCSLEECEDVLNDMERVLQRFIEQLNTIQRDIGDVRETLTSTTTQLSNTRNTEKVLWTAVSQLVVPPEVVQVVTQSNEEQLGPQFQLCISQLLKFLNYRRATWRQGGECTIAKQRQQQMGMGLNASDGSTTSATDVAASGEQQQQQKSQAAALREVRISMTDCRVYLELMNTLDELTLYSCIKIKSFLSKKLSVLAVRDTNVCIQQENTLKPLSYYVQFLRSAAPLLRHAHTGGQLGERQTTLVPYRIAKALYSEFKGEYCSIMSTLYLSKLRDYVFTCNIMEYPTTGPSTSTGGSGRLFGAGSSGSGVGGGAPFAYCLPLIVEAKQAADADKVKLGGRGAIFRHVFAPPLIPTMEKASHRRHSYEETFRSLLSLTCDIVTHEYLFTFQFFAGDMSVYVEVFKPTLQFVIDYVSEVILCRSSTGSVRQMLNARPRTAVNEFAQQDCYGMLILIRLCHEYSALMKYSRKLSCLDGFFDSLLLLLWPAFKSTFERQLAGLRCIKYENHTACMSSLKSLEDKLRVVHPLVRSFTEFVSVILGILLNSTTNAAISPLLQWQKETSGSKSPLGEGKTTRSTLKSVAVTYSEPQSPATIDLSPSAPSLESLADTVSSVTMAGQGHAEKLAETAAGRVESHARLRRRALDKIAAEKESDVADSVNRFSALLGTLAFMQVELVHFLESLAAHLVAQEPNLQVRQRLEPLKMSFVLNNVYFMLQSIGIAGAIEDTSGDVARSPASPLAATRSTLATSQQRLTYNSDNDDDEHDERIHPTAAAAIASQASETLTVLTEAYTRYRVTFVESVIKVCFPSFFEIAHSAHTLEPQQVLEAAEQFTISWKSSLDALWNTIRRLISDPVHEQEIIAQACMECLLLNTRFHSSISSVVEEHREVFAGRATRNLIITNQQLLQYMRTFSIVNG